MTPEQSESETEMSSRFTELSRLRLPDRRRKLLLLLRTFPPMLLPLLTLLLLRPMPSVNDALEATDWEEDEFRLPRELRLPLRDAEREREKRLWRLLSDMRGPPSLRAEMSSLSIFLLGIVVIGDAVCRREVSA